MAASTTLLAWGALDYKTGYTAASQMPETLNTIKWATDYFIKCHTATNELYVQVEIKSDSNSASYRVSQKRCPFLKYQKYS